jgi:hypothetical protein
MARHRELRCQKGESRHLHRPTSVRLVICLALPVLGPDGRFTFTTDVNINLETPYGASNPWYTLKHLAMLRYKEISNAYVSTSSYWPYVFASMPSGGSGTTVLLPTLLQSVLSTVPPLSW